METQNEQKANEIVDKFYGNFVPFHAHSKAFEECAKAKNAVLDAMEWKDEQHAKEKQQWIDEATQFINDKLKGKRIEWRDEYCWSLESFIKQFKQAMKGE